MPLQHISRAVEDVAKRIFMAQKMVQSFQQVAELTKLGSSSLAGCQRLLWVEKVELGEEGCAIGLRGQRTLHVID